MEVVRACSGQGASPLRVDEGGGDWSQQIPLSTIRPDPAADAARHALAQVIETEIIPRLALAHGARPPGRAASPEIVPATMEPGAAQVEAFATLLRTRGYHTVHAHVQGLAEAGMRPETILLKLFAPTARLLGELWKADICDFVEVTMALSMLQQLVREHSSSIVGEGMGGGDKRRVLLAPAPGDPHTFGIAIVEKFFRSSGWDVWGGAAGLAFDLPALVKREWFGIVGFSLGSERYLDSLPPLIRRLRRVSRNPNLRIVVGGAAFLERPELGVLIGADSTAIDAQSAVSVAQGLLAHGAATG
ncbi:cobalamin-dependent protein [Alsobacter sp. KACC 23698]|uniref:Cobalamin-dependent protein n=1 Tax=Alsobacter sp. KACC 23698 TaxID=3149229 RepID=A0AAU7JDP2_9HYPH